METLRWMRMIGDVLFLFGVAAFTYFMSGLYLGWSYEPTRASAAVPDAPPVRV